MELGDIISIVRKASSLMVTDHFEVTQKGGYANIVTTSDVAVQEFLCKELSCLLPGSGFICEEENVYDDNQLYTWIIDPIDGTANYSRGIPQCAISVGLEKGKEMIMGVVYCPYTNELFYAEKGKGAFYNGHRINVSSKPFANSLLCSALCVYHKEHSELCSKFILKAFNECNDVRRFGPASLEICYLAMGRVDLYFEYVVCAWDHAAASLILYEAGGVNCARDGKAMEFDKSTMYFAANNKKNLDRLVEIFREVSDN